MSVIYGDCKVDCTTDETKLWLSPFAKQHQNPCSGYPPAYQDLSTRHDWPIKKDIVDLPIRMKAGTAEGEGLVGPRPHHFFAPSPPPTFCAKKKNN